MNQDKKMNCHERLSDILEAFGLDWGNGATEITLAQALTKIKALYKVNEKKIEKIIRKNTYHFEGFRSHQIDDIPKLAHIIAKRIGNTT